MIRNFTFQFLQLGMEGSLASVNTVHVITKVLRTEKELHRTVVVKVNC